MQEFRQLLDDAQGMLPAGNQERIGRKMLVDLGQLRAKLENELEVAQTAKANYESRKTELEREEVRREEAHARQLAAMDRLCEKMNDVVKNKMNDVVDRLQDDVVWHLNAKMDAAIERLQSEMGEHVDTKINAAIARLGEVRSNTG